MTTVSIEDRAATIMAKIMKNIDEAAERQQAQRDQIALRKAEREVEGNERLRKAHAYLTPILKQAVKGCQNIFDLVDQSPSFQAIISHIEQSGERKQFSQLFRYFHFFLTDAPGANENGYDDMHLYMSLRANRTIELYIERFDRSDPAVISFEGNTSPLVKLREIFFSGFIWKNSNQIERMAAQYKRISSPLSWNIPVNQYREDWPTFQLVALRVLAQCAHPKMLERYIAHALQKVVH